MKYLCDEIFLIIYSFVGNNALYLDKSYLKILQERRKYFINNPIKLKFKIINIKYPSNRIIINKNNNLHRPSIKVEKKIKFILINSNVFIGNIKNDYDPIFGLSNEIYPSNQLKRKIIVKELLMDNLIYLNTRITYQDIFLMWTEDYENVKRYSELWVK
tara:strand:- start:309 stop:785 length:477 start_codon:yes stop_codon:yes gene_type:complete